jgi:hypothetical protein
MAYKFNLNLSENSNSTQQLNIINYWNNLLVFYYNKSMPFENVRYKAMRPWDLGEISLLVLFIFGTVGNTLTIIVMRSKRMRNTNVSLSIIYIALADILLLGLKFLTNMIKLYHVPVYNFCILLQTISQTASYSSIWLIILTSIERLCAVLFPLDVATVFTRNRCHFIIVAMITFFFLLSNTLSICINYSPFYPYYCQIKGQPNGPCYKYYNLVYPWIRSTLSSWLPSVLGIVLNALIINALYKSNQLECIGNNMRSSIELEKSVKNRSSALIKIPLSMPASMLTSLASVNKSPSNNSIELNESTNINKLAMPSKAISASLPAINKHLRRKSIRKRASFDERTLIYKHKMREARQITFMLLSISIVFVILTLPYSIFELLRKLNVSFRFLKSRTYLRACLFLIDLNHSTNFVFYCLTAQKFRSQLVEILCSLRNYEFGRQAKRLNHSSLYSTNFTNLMQIKRHS